MDAWAASPHRDGFVMQKSGTVVTMHGRFGGRVVIMESGNSHVRYRGEGFDVALDLSAPAATASGTAESPVDLTWLHIMDKIFKAVTDPRAINYAGMILESA